jgi:Nif-specific regulatory protein
VTTELETVRREREFYRSLLALCDHENLDVLLGEALTLLVARVGAREAMIEVIGDDIDGPPHVVAHGCDGNRVAAISSFVSRGIIGQAMATGTPIVTANAAQDPRFLQFESVRRNQLEAVLCMPIGRTMHVGVLYLQGKQGASDFQPYGAEVQREVELAARTLSGPLERLLSRRDTVVPEPRRAKGADDPFSAIRGRSQVMADVVERLRLAAPLDVHVLLTGPSGVGKTLLANAVHLASRRRGGPFVEINCAAIPENLLENEMFGAEAGAYTGAARGGTKGKVEAAEGGTLFLDEIAELSPGAQAKLLQLLQSKTYYRLGSSEIRHADVRVVTATNVNLKTAIAEKKFREDLYFRLGVLEARVPSLAERSDDLIPLALVFLKQALERHQLPRKSLSPSAVRALQSAEWPGNVRQLSNRIESATIHAHLRGSDYIEGHDIFPDDPRSPEDTSATLQSATRRFQRNHILGVLTSTEWNMHEAARILDVSRSQIYNLVRIHELKDLRRG